uniref:Uncharacterized protein n=1 Tax=Caenorhabditis japonica TaxID=281687 RepID=A0A8R1I1V9_CAEJA
MGCCSSSPAQFQQRKSPALKYRSSYRKGERDLANVIAGKKGPCDDYSFMKYTNRISDIVEASKALVPLYERVRHHYECGLPVNDPVMVAFYYSFYGMLIFSYAQKARYALDNLRRDYEAFFTDSRWKVDPRVDERKKMATRQFFQIDELYQNIIDILEKSTGPKFEEIELAIRDQVGSAMEIEAHFNRYKNKRVRKEDVEEIKPIAAPAPRLALALEASEDTTL